MSQVSGKQSSTKYIDYLTEDQQIPHQNYVCLSFLSPEGIKNCSVRGLKVRGVYNTREEADAQCKRLNAIDPDFHVFVGEVGRWLPWDPDPNSAEDQVYREKELNDLMKGYKENLEKTKRMEAQRKNDMINNAAQEEQTKLQQRQNRMRKKLEEKRQKERMTELAKKQLISEDADSSDDSSNSTNVNASTDTNAANANNLGKVSKNKRKKNKGKNKNQADVDTNEKLLDADIQIKKNEELAKAERDRLESNRQAINEKKNRVETIDDKLKKIQQLYNKLNTN